MLLRNWSRVFMWHFFKGWMNKMEKELGKIATTTKRTLLQFKRQSVLLRKGQLNVSLYSWIQQLLLRKWWGVFDAVWLLSLCWGKDDHWNQKGHFTKDILSIKIVKYPNSVFQHSSSDHGFSLGAFTFTSTRLCTALRATGPSCTSGPLHFVPSKSYLTGPKKPKMRQGVLWLLFQSIRLQKGSIEPPI